MKRFLASLIITCFLSCVGILAIGQVQDPVSWKVSTNKVDDKKYEIIFDASIEMGWHLYSSQNPEGGPIVTTFNAKDPKGYVFSGKLLPLGKAKEEFDQIFGMKLSYFAAQGRFVQAVELEEGLSGATIIGEMEYQVCYEDKCIFLTKDFEISVGETKKTVEVAKPTTEIATSSTQKADGADKSDSSLFVFFLICFGFGLLGLLTPCVFPMIPMTISFFMSQQRNRFNSILNAFVFGISIILIYTSIGLLVSLTGVGASFTSMLVSHWIPNTLFFILFMVFAASFFGLFEIMLPSSLSTKTDSKAEKGGIIGSFFMALTLVIVSLSCVGPIVGAILVEAASGLGLKPIVGMFGFSLAFSIPFTLFAIFPSWLNKLPKSGGWLNSVKIVLGFIVLAFGFKFLSTIDQAYHLGILGRDVFLAIWIAIFSMLGLYLLGKIKFKFDSPVQHIGFFRMILAIATFAFVIYLIPGLFGAPLSGLSGLIPSKTTQSFDLEKLIGKQRVAVDTDKATICEEPRYADILHLPLGLNGYFDYNQALACAREHKKPLFLDFVGHSCANCKVMEQKVFSDPRVIEKLQNNFIVVALYVDERTKLPESEWVTSTFDGKVKNTVGKKNADLQITRFNVNSQPYYAILGNQEEVLAEPFGFNTNIDEFLKFLDKGIEQFKAKNTPTVFNFGK
jgi:thiol:disulfide interchange protein DsbD